jgi:hypothetical protein
MAQARWLAGRARDPHYTRTPEKPGALRPIRELVDRVVADLERLITWQFTPPIVRHELNAKLKPTGRIVSSWRFGRIATLRPMTAAAATSAPTATKSGGHCTRSATSAIHGANEAGSHSTSNGGTCGRPPATD